MMFAPVVQLEYLKQRPLLVHIIAAMVLTLTIASSRQLITRQSLQDGLSAMFVLLAVVGLPLVAILLAGSSGSALRTKSARRIEESLPFHPVSAFLTAYGINLVQFFCVAFLIFTGVILTEASNGIEAITDWNWNDPVWILVILQLHALSFALSYFSKSAIAGTASALAICGLQLSLYFPLTESWPYWISESGVIISLYVIAGISPFLVATFIAFHAKTLYREGRLSFVSVTALVILLFGGTIALFAQSLYREKRYEKELYPLWLSSDVFSLVTRRSSRQEGVLFTTASGTVVRVSAQGEPILLGKFPYAYDTIAREDTSIWMVNKIENDSYAIRYEQSGRIHDYTSFSSPDVDLSSISVHENKVYLFGNLSGKGQVYSLLTSPHSKPVWQTNTWKSNFRERSYDPLIQDGKIAYPSDDRKQLLRRRADGSIHHWNLPGLAAGDVSSLRSSLYPAVFVAKDGPAFLVSVLDSRSKQRLIVCLPDGTVAEPWKQVRFDRDAKLVMHTLPDGGATVYTSPATTIYILDAKGNPMMPIDVPRLSKETFVRIKKLSGTYLWAMVNGAHFVRFDLRTGSHEVLLELDEKAWMSLQSAEEGIYFTHRGKIRLLDWDGKISVVRSAYLE